MSLIRKNEVQDENEIEDKRRIKQEKEENLKSVYSVKRMKEIDMWYLDIN